MQVIKPMSSSCWRSNGSFELVADTGETWTLISKSLPSLLDLLGILTADPSSRNAPALVSGPLFAQNLQETLDMGRRSGLHRKRTSIDKEHPLFANHKDPVPRVVAPPPRRNMGAE